MQVVRRRVLRCSGDRVIGIDRDPSVFRMAQAWADDHGDRLRLAGDARPVLSLLQLAAQPGFPAQALGQRVSAGRHVGELCRVSPDGRQFWLRNERSGAEQLFDTAFWRAKADQA